MVDAWDLCSGQTLSPKAEGLFQRVVLQSGVATVGAYTIRDPLPQAKVAPPASEQSPLLLPTSQALSPPDHRQPDRM